MDARSEIREGAGRNPRGGLPELFHLRGGHVENKSNSYQENSTAPDMSGPRYKTFQSRLVFDKEGRTLDMK